MPARSQSSLLRLNEDVFNEILEELLVCRALKPFSRTCKLVRQLCMPVLFRQCVVLMRGSISSHFLPDVLWPYIRSITFIDKCSGSRTLRAWSEAPSPMPGTEDALLCCAYDTTALSKALRSMPQLSRVSFISRYPGSDHSLPWSVVQTILAVPQLRELICDNYLLSPESPLPSALSIVAPAPLTSFRYLRREYLDAAHPYPAEKEAVDVILSMLHDSLEAIALPSQLSLLDTFASLSWASLHELSLRGHPPVVEPSTSYVCALRNMPKLRVLELMFPYPSHTLPQAIWPPDCDVTYPWPDLERLTVSFPRVEDQLYAHLPSTLRSLALRYVPHLACSRWSPDQSKLPWRVPLLPSRDLSCILNSCNISALEDLEIEYHQDQSEGDLLQLVSIAFPALKSLKLLRYQTSQAAGSGVDIETIAQTLGRLEQLRTISLHLDLPETPRRYYLPGLVGAHNFRSQDMKTFSLAQDHAADIFAQHLAPSVTLIKMLRPTFSGHEWAIFRVIRQDSEGRPLPPIAQYDHDLTRPDEQYGISIAPSPPPVVDPGVLPFELPGGSRRRQGYVC
ncbi:hypothetical protein BV20DRAFT_1031398 [Pilatotrama ljubarskyi]|nr:hypothetical protein BV20DRAFT_1031398 [Pilatotrama ljubarskyi]